MRSRRIRHTLWHMLLLARPHHWTKNAIVLLPMTFAKRVLDPNAWGAAIAAAAAFCFASSAMYILNDIRDRHNDQAHPFKRTRPLASGAVTVPSACLGLSAAALIALAIAWAVSPSVLSLVLAYMLLQTGYSLYLKQKMIIDVICIALGFVLRASTGAVAIGVEPSLWLVICTFTLCLFIGFCKRRNEAATISDVSLAAAHRKTLTGYTPELLTHLTTLAAGVTIVAYLQYATSPLTVERFGTHYLAYTLPLIVYGIARMEMLSIKGCFQDPVDILFRDHPLQATILLWLVSSTVVVLWGPEIMCYLAGL